MPTVIHRRIHAMILHHHGRERRFFLAGCGSYWCDMSDHGSTLASCRRTLVALDGRSSWSQRSAPSCCDSDCNIGRASHCSPYGVSGRSIPSVSPAVCFARIRLTASATRDALLRRGRERLKRKAMRKFTGKVMRLLMKPTYILHTHPQTHLSLVQHAQTANRKQPY